MTNMNSFPWINPIGGFGDMLMVSGIIKQVNDLNPEKKFNMVRRTNYLAVFKSHPAIEIIGFPRKDAKIVDVDYWSMAKLGSGNKRAYQVLAKSFGLKLPAEETLYLPSMNIKDELLMDFVPWKSINIAISVASDSPRKVMPAPLWHRLVDMLKRDDYFVLQLGRSRDLHIRNAFSILGLTDIRQAIKVIEQVDLIITADNFVMHAAHMIGKPAVVLWGATIKDAYGYDEHYHIEARRTCKLPMKEECIDVRKSRDGSLYGSHCPHGDKHCMASIKPDEIYRLIKSVL